jgi:hypothetical protein
MAKNPVVTVSAAVIGAVVGYWVVNHTLHGPASTHQFLIEAADAANKKLPMMVDSETRWDKTEVGADGRNVLIYDYTLPNVIKNQVDVASLQKMMRIQLVQNYKTSDVMQALRDRGVELDYKYVDKNGDLVFEQDISPKDF